MTIRSIGAAWVAAMMMAGWASGSARAQQIPELVPVNPLLSAHTAWFEPVKIYDLKKDHYPLPDSAFPRGLTYEVHSAVGYDLANTIVIQGPARNAAGQRELVIVDTLGNPGITTDTIAALRKAGALPATGKLPIRAIIYTHNHIDHAYGVHGYLAEADRPPCKAADPLVAGPDGAFDVDRDNPNCVAIIAQADIEHGVAQTATVTGTIIDARSSYMYGSFLFRNRVNDGIGPDEKTKVITGPNGERIAIKPSYQLPSRTFANDLYVTAAGVHMKLFYAPSETNDELAIFVPDSRNQTGVTPKKDDWGGPGLMFSAEVLQGPAFPNIYSLRGTTYRDPTEWVRSIDAMRAYNSWCIVPSHGPPLCGPKNVQTLMRNYRDAVQFTYDQTIRWMNKGYRMDQLAIIVEQLYLKRGEEERIMKDLDTIEPILNVDHKVVDPRDYLRPFYGSVPQAVREIYMGSVGWFQADPTQLRPTPPDELARRYVGLMGGGARINDVARQAIGDGDPEYAAELTTQVITAYLGDSDPAKLAQFNDAKTIKARALTELGARAENPNWRNFYITAARELQNYPLPTAITGGLVSPGVIGNLPAGAWVNSLTFRLRAEDTAPLPGQKSMGFWFPSVKGDDNQGFGPLGYILVVRGGIAEFVAKRPDGALLTRDDVAHATYAISIEQKALAEILNREAEGPKAFTEALLKAYREHKILALNGTIEDFASVFFKWFDPKPVVLPPLTVGLPTPVIAPH